MPKYLDNNLINIAFVYTKQKATMWPEKDSKNRVNYEVKDN
jgi:hypothetical protein